MEFVIKRCPPEPTVAKGLERTWLLKVNGIYDEAGTILGRIERRTCEQGAVCGTVDDVLLQKGVVTAIFTTRIGPTPEFVFTYDDRSMSVHPLNHFICEEIQARTVLSWFPEGQCTYSIDDTVDPISALFLYQMLERIDAATE